MVVGTFLAQNASKMRGSHKTYTAGGAHDGSMIGVDEPAAPPQPDLPDLADAAIELVERWLVAARASATSADTATAERLHGVVVDPGGVAFAMRFVDRVVRPDDHRVAAGQLAALVAAGQLPGFLSPVDRMLLRVGARVARLVPGIVMPLAIRRMRALIGHLVVDAEPDRLAAHLAARRSEGFRLNVNLLGEAVLGGREADRRLAEAHALLTQPDVDYVSIKLSAIVADLDHWDLDTSVERVVERLGPLLERALVGESPTFVNLDMEEYHDLELTVAAFTRLLDEPRFHRLEAGIVLQAYLPDSFEALRHLVDWADARHRRLLDGAPGAPIKIRLVKGANLAMERVEAELRGWEQAPYGSKAETDANYKRCLDWVLTPERTAAAHIGVASHNLFDVAWARLVSTRRGVADRVEFEMLQGMAGAEARVVRDDTGAVLLYTPAVARADFDVAISYLFRRLEENAADENFIRHLFDLDPASPSFEHEAGKFRAAVAGRWRVSSAPRRRQDRGTPPVAAADDGFVNESDTDPALAANRRWAAAVLAQPYEPAREPMCTDPAVVDERVARCRDAQQRWQQVPATERRAALRSIADELARRRGDLISAMVHEGRKTFEQADPEVSEAIDFARYYADRAVELDGSDSARFEPAGVIAVVPPWNFPVAISAGGVLAALAAGNGVVLKPAPEVPRCAELVAECVVAGLRSAGHEASLAEHIVGFVRTPDDDVGRHLVTHRGVDAVILTGAYETADLFRSWQPDLRIFAETSGKNALVITPNADIDLAVADLVSSAFGHSGQKCSAASLSICVGGVYRSARFRRQLVDAVESLRIGPAGDLGTEFGPTIEEPSGKLLRGLTVLDVGEEWLVTPRRVDIDGVSVWTPGVRIGVRAGSWFHQTECFGPVLGLIHADDLDEAIAIQNATGYGLTGGLHTLDPTEISRWLDRVEVGNAYVNRAITGAIVQRQPFGGWKRSSIGPGAKAGGPNYVAQLGRWTPRSTSDADGWLERATAGDAATWRSHFGVEHDPTGLACESNVFRYRPLERGVIRRQPDGSAVAAERVGHAAVVACGADAVSVSDAHRESTAEFAARLSTLGVDRVRVVGSPDHALRVAAHAAGVHLADDPVTPDPRLELRHFVREQAVSRSMHRYGNLIAP